MASTMASLDLTLIDLERSNSKLVRFESLYRIKESS